LGISFIVFTITMVLINSVTKSLERASNIERSNQIFFGTESGLEAAFFHHNARGQGVHFPGNGDICKDSSLASIKCCDNAGTPADCDPSDSQKILHNKTGVQTKWKIFGRANSYDGLLKENETIQIPLFWDNADNAEEAEDKDELDKTSLYLQLIFSNIQNESALFTNSFDFGHSTDEILIDWSASRIKTVSSVETNEIFKPKITDIQDKCNITNADSIICKNELFDIPSPTINTNDSSITGVINSETNENLDQFFLNDANLSNFKITFRPLLPFTKEDLSTKIPGIPFEINIAQISDDAVLTNNPPFALPLPFYTIETEVSLGNFSKKLTTKIKEKTDAGFFDYIIFD